MARLAGQYVLPVAGIALAEYSEGTPVPETENRRDWDFGRPFVAHNGGMEMLGTDVRPLGA